MIDFIVDKRKELENCNFIKTILMLAVVVGHSVAIWSGTGWFNKPAQTYFLMWFVNEWVSSYHIYAFVLVSGYIYQYLRYEKGKYNDKWAFVALKAKRLLLPYIFVSLVWAIPFYSLFYRTDISIIFKNYVLAVSPSQLWFLWMLFGVFLFERVIFDNIHNVQIKLVLALMMWGLGFVGTVFSPNYFQIFNVLQYYVFFCLGMAIRNNNGIGVYMRKIPLIAWILLHISFLAIKIALSSSDTIFLKITYQGVCLLLHMVGAVTMFFFLNFIASKIKWHSSKLFRILTKYNFVIYLFHQQMIWCSIALLLDRVPIWLVLSINIICGITIPVCIGMACCRASRLRSLWGIK